MALLLHTPPGVEFDNVVEPGKQKDVVPVILFTEGEAFTTCVIAGDVLAEKFAGLVGVYSAVTAYEPVAGLEMVMLLVPPTSAVGGPNETPSKKNSTVPVAEFGVTVAVSVIFSLSHDGLLLEVTAVVVAVCAIRPVLKKVNNRKIIKSLNPGGP